MLLRQRQKSSRNAMAPRRPTASTAGCHPARGAFSPPNVEIEKRSSSAAASASVPGIRCPYRSKVTLIEE